MGQFIKIESDSAGSAKITYLLKSDQDGVYNWPQNRLQWGRSSERPAAHTQQTLTQVSPPPPPPGFQLTLSEQEKLTRRDHKTIWAIFRKRKNYPNRQQSEAFLSKNCKSKLMSPFTAFYDTDNLKIETRLEGFTVT